LHTSLSFTFFKFIPILKIKYNLVYESFILEMKNRPTSNKFNRFATPRS
jgi:hypothetical protein